jgi:hypothetical protein
MAQGRLKKKVLIIPDKSLCGVIEDKTQFKQLIKLFHRLHEISAVLNCTYLLQSFQSLGQ